MDQCVVEKNYRKRMKFSPNRAHAIKTTSKKRVCDLNRRFSEYSLRAKNLLQSFYLTCISNLRSFLEEFSAKNKCRGRILYTKCKKMQATFRCFSAFFEFHSFLVPETTCTQI